MKTILTVFINQDMLLQNDISVFFYALLTTRKGKIYIFITFLQSKTRLGLQDPMKHKQENTKIKYTF